MEVEENKKVLFSASHKQAMSIHFLGSRASVHAVVALGDKRSFYS